MDRGNLRQTSQRDQVTTWEQHLVSLAQKGDAVAFELLMDIHQKQVKNHALRLLRNYEDAEDATQETFIKAFKALKNFDSQRSLLPWLMRICSNCCIDIVRVRQKSGENIENYEHALTDDRAGVEETADIRSQAREIEHAISQLPDHYRKVVEMRHLDHLAVSEIAAKTGAPEGTVKSWLFRARCLLAKELKITPA